MHTGTEVELKFLAAIATWAGCLLPYLASRRQLLTDFTLPRPLAWSGFGVALALATLLLSSTYNVVSATLLASTCVMCVWPGLILAAPHLRSRPLLLNVLGPLALMLILAAA